MSWYVMVSHHYILDLWFSISLFFSLVFGAGRRWWWRGWWWRTAHSTTNSWSSGCHRDRSSNTNASRFQKPIKKWCTRLQVDRWIFFCISGKNTFLEELLWISALIRWVGSWHVLDFVAHDYQFVLRWLKRQQWLRSSLRACRSAVSHQQTANGPKGESVCFFFAGRTCVPAQSGGLKQKVVNNTAVHVSCFLHPLFNLRVG